MATSYADISNTHTNRGNTKPYEKPLQRMTRQRIKTILLNIKKEALFIKQALRLPESDPERLESFSKRIKS